jgi:hypothetical protein
VVDLATFEAGQDLGMVTAHVALDGRDDVVIRVDGPLRALEIPWQDLMRVVSTGSTGVQARPAYGSTTGKCGTMSAS